MTRDEVRNGAAGSAQADGAARPLNLSSPQGRVRLGLNLSEAANALGISRGFLAKLIEQGKIRRVIVGRRAIVAVTELERFLAEAADE